MTDPHQADASRRRVSVVLPTYNEAENIAALVKAIDTALADWQAEIIVVDDDSPDGTWRIVQEEFEDSPHVRLIHRKTERGLTSALQAGISAAQGEVVCWLDCDFQHPPEALPDLLAKTDEGYDVVVGSRFLRPGGDARVRADQERLIRFHGLLSRVLSKTITTMIDTKFTDWTSGLIAVRRSLLLSVPLEGDYGEYFIPLLFELERRGARACEVPYALTTREQGTSKTSGDLLGFVRKGMRYATLALSLPVRQLVRGRPASGD